MNEIVQQAIRDIETARSQLQGAIKDLREDQRQVQRDADTKIRAIEDQICQIEALTGAQTKRIRQKGRPRIHVTAECGLVWQRVRDYLHGKREGAHAKVIAAVVGTREITVYQAVKAHPDVFVKVSKGIYALRTIHQATETPA